MCLIALAWNVDPERPLVLIANRDEFFERPTAALDFWTDAPDLAAGRDLRDGGTWLGVSRRGRMAAVTNVREPGDVQRHARSRGALTADFLRGKLNARTHADQLMASAQHYGGFNLLLWDGRDLVYASNRPEPNHFVVTPGLHALSNAQLDTPWPKTRWAHRQIESWMNTANAPAEALLGAMTTRELAGDFDLPDTGVGLEAERLLAPPFIFRPGYGTRCTTWLQIARGAVQMREQRYNDQGQPAGESELRFELV